jgi:hypothetical protein
MVRDEAPAATRGGINEWELTAGEFGSALPGCHSVRRSDQLRCCGSPSWTSVSRLQRRADRNATYKLRATRVQTEYLAISSCSETKLEAAKPASKLCREQLHKD